MLTLQEARKIAPDLDLTDEELQKAIQDLYSLANVAVPAFIKSKEK